MLKRFVSLFVLYFALVLLAPEKSEAKNLGVATCIANRCVVRKANWGGGLVSDFLITGTGIERGGKMLVINYPCASSCALLANQIRSITCITPKAYFGFHMILLKDGREWPPPHEADIRGWVERHGGFPSYASKKILWMPYEDAKQFWRTC